MAHKVTCPQCGAHLSRNYAAALGVDPLTFQFLEDPDFACVNCGADLMAADLPEF